MEQIEPYITSKASGLSWYHYLHIHGGVGHGKDMGGKYNFVVTYLTPDESAAVGETSLDTFCKHEKIPWGGGSTIEEAYAGFKKAFELNPIR